MKRLLLSLLILVLLLIPAVVNASDIGSAYFYGTIRATNNGTAASSVCANVSINTTSLINLGILNSAVNNVVIQNATGGDTYFMPGWGTNPWIVYFDNVSANSSMDYTLYTGASNVTTIAFFPPDAGMTTLDDDADFELGDNFTWKWEGYLGTSGDLVNKPYAFTVHYDLASEKITASIPGFYSSKIKVYASNYLAGDTTDPNIDVDIYYSGAWHNIWSANVTKDTWTELPFGSNKYILDTRIKSNALEGSQYLRLNEFQIYGLNTSTWLLATSFTDPDSVWSYENYASNNDTNTYAYTLTANKYLQLAPTLENLSISVTGVASGEHTTIVSANTTDFMMSVD